MDSQDARRCKREDIVDIKISEIEMTMTLKYFIPQWAEKEMIAQWSTGLLRRDHIRYYFAQLI